MLSVIGTSIHVNKSQKNIEEVYRDGVPKMTPQYFYVFSSIPIYFDVNFCQPGLVVLVMWDNKNLVLYN